MASYGSGAYGAGLYGHGSTGVTDGYGSGAYGAGAYGVEASGASPFWSSRKPKPFRNHPPKRNERVLIDDDEAVALMLALL